MRVVNAMAPNVSHVTPGRLQKPLRSDGEGSDRRGESVPQKLRIDGHARELGHALERALRNTGWTNGAAAYQMGYGDNQTSLGAWIAGRENPQMARLRMLGEDFWNEWALQQLALTGTVQQETVVRVPRSRRVAR